MALSDEIAARIKVRVDVPASETRINLCGEKMQEDNKGRFFVIPGHMAGYVNEIFPSYVVGEEFEVEKPKRGRAAKDAE